MVGRMKVASLVALRKFQLHEAPITPPGPGEIQVAIRSVGICGSDVHAYAEGAVGDLAVPYPVVLGHEPTGTVVALGAGVSGWAMGEAAALEPAHFCYHCAQCLRGRHNLCSNLRFLSAGSEPGFFRERVNLPVANLLRLPANLGLKYGTLAEPLAVILHSLALARPTFGETAVVIGAGPIGLLTIAALRRAGVSRVTAVEPLPHRRELARAMGAQVALTGPAADVGRQIVSDSRGQGVDLVFDCATKGTEALALEIAASGGRVVYTGITSERQVAFDVHLWRRKELEVHQVRRSIHEGAAAVRMLAEDVGFFAPLVTHEKPLDGINAAFAQVESYADGVGKLVVQVE
jgi:L-iditol 2-dehydrogenase